MEYCRAYKIYPIYDMICFDVSVSFFRNIQNDYTHL